jgi:glutaredoxin
MSLEQPSPSIPNPQPLVKQEEEEEKKKPEEQEEEEEDEDKLKKSQKKGRISVTMFGSISGQHKCPYCVTAHQYFSKPIQWKKFHYKHIDIMSDKGLKTAYVTDNNYSYNH